MRSQVRVALLFPPLLLAAAALQGCAAMRVHPWDRDLLAKDSMKLAPTVIEGAADEHIYFSKEGSTGGNGAGGGGCGCN